MTGLVLPAGPVYRGIDTVQVITRAKAEALASAGISWVARYIPRDGRRLDVPDRDGGDWGGCWTLSIQEVEWILDAGLLLLPVQWGPRKGEHLTAESGHLAGRHARSACRHLGIPAGVHLFADLEGGSARRAGGLGCVEWCEAYAAEAGAGGIYGAGLYYDNSSPMSPWQLYGIKGITSYWAGGNDPRPPRRRGCAVEQDPPTTVIGIPCDTDTIRGDRFGDVPILAAR